MDRHAYFAKEEDEAVWFTNVDKYGDSFFRDLEAEELGKLLGSMADGVVGGRAKGKKCLREVVGLGQERLGRGLMFCEFKAYFEGEHAGVLRTFEFAGGEVADDLEDEGVTHVVVVAKGSERVDEIRRLCARRSKMPRLVTPEWVEACWEAGDWRDEEGFAP
jgi:DNA ligase-4